MAINDQTMLNHFPFNEMSPADLAKFRFATMVSCDVECSFSMFKSELRDNDRLFLIENLKEHLISASYFKSSVVFLILSKSLIFLSFYLLRCKYFEAQVT